MPALLVEHAVTWRNAVDGGENGPIHSAWNVQAWPTTYVLDAQGIVRWRDSTGEDMEAVVDTLLIAMAAEPK